MSLNETIDVTLDGSKSTLEVAFAKASAGAAKLAKEITVATGGLSSAEKEAGRLAKQAEQAGKNAAALNSIKWSELFQGLQGAYGMMKGFVEQGVKAAQFRIEFERLGNAIPAAKMAELERETQGTVSRFDLLTRAAKEMNLSATAGMDATVLAGQRTLVVWENYVDAAKRGMGGIVLAALDGLDRLSDKLADVDRRLQRGATPGQVAQANAERATDVALLRRAEAGDYRLRGQADRLEQDQGISVRAQEVIDRDTAEWRREYRIQLAIASRRALDGVLSQGLRAAQAANSAAELAGAGGALLDAFGRPLAGALGGSRRTNLIGSIFGGGGASGGGGRVRGTAGGGHGGLAYGPAQWLGGGTGYGPSAFPDQDALGGIGRGASTFFGGLGAAAGALGDTAGLADRGGARGAAQAKRFDDFAKDMQDKATILGGTLSVLQTGIAAAVEAAITGADSMGAAWRRASAAGLKALSVEYGIRAGGSVAHAIFAGAIGDPRAAGFALSALKFGAMSAAAGVAAAALGGGGGGGGGGGPSAPGGGYVSSAGRGGGGGNTTIVYEIHGVVSAATHRELGGQLEKSRQKALSSGTARRENSRTARVE